MRAAHAHACDLGVCAQVRPAAKAAGVQETQDALFAFFLERVRTNLHVVICLSPIGDAFRERCRMFPGLVNCTTIDWFTQWPSDALFEVASKLLESENVGGDETRTAICQVRAFAALLQVTAHCALQTALCSAIGVLTVMRAPVGRVTSV